MKIIDQVSRYISTSNNICNPMQLYQDTSVCEVCYRRPTKWWNVQWAGTTHSFDDDTVQYTCDVRTWHSILLSLYMQLWFQHLILTTKLYSAITSRRQHRPKRLNMTQYVYDKYAGLCYVKFITRETCIIIMHHENFYCIILINFNEDVGLINFFFNSSL
jgi:hypothetical protein